MSSNPSVHEANKLVRVLSGERLKYTVRLHLPDGKIIEWQANDRPRLSFSAEARALWLMGTEYGTAPIMPWPDGAVLLMEENPKV